MYDRKQLSPKRPSRILSGVLLVVMVTSCLSTAATPTLRLYPNQPIPPQGKPSWDSQSTSTATPPPGLERDEYSPADPILIEGVPAYPWYRGCGPTAAGMVLGYWDGRGYSDLFPGGAATITPAIEDRLASQAHYVDYSLPIDYYPNLFDDKSELPAGDEHTDNSLADFMDTSQSAWENRYGWSWLSDMEVAMEQYVTYFTPMYTGSAATIRYSQGLTYAVYVAQIDAGRPVVFLVDTNGNNATDHFVTGVGYAQQDGKDLYGVYNTWDYTVHWYEFKRMASGVTYGVYAMTTFFIEGEVADYLGLSGSDTAPEDRFGIAVDVDGDTAVVGAYGNQPTGAAYVFQRDPVSGEWLQIKKLTPTDGGAGDYFGVSVAISGNTILVGSLWHDHSSISDPGAAYVFQRNNGGTDNWGQVKKLTLGSSAADGDEMGISVAVNNGIALVGVHRYDGAANDGGAVAVYYRNEGGTVNWGLVAVITAADADENAYLGYRLALDGDTALVGAYGADLVGASGAGAAYIFRQHTGGANHWGQVAKLTAADAGAGDAFGLSVTLQGSRAVVGAYLHDHAGFTDAGAAYYYNRDQGGSEYWGQVQKITAAQPGDSHWFGDALKLHGTSLLIGNHRDDTLSIDAGSVHQYIFSHDSEQWNYSRSILAGDGLSGDWFGYAISASLGRILTGAPHDDNQGNNAGVVYFDPLFPSDTAGTYEPAEGRFKIRYSNTAGLPDSKFIFGGAPGYLPIKGDWDGDGVDTIGVYDPVLGMFKLRNTNDFGPYDEKFTFGGNGNVNLPVAGDWDGNGTDTIGVYVIATGKFKLRNTNDSGTPNHSFVFVGGSLIPLAGDWNGDGIDTVGVYTPVTGNFKLVNSHMYSPPDIKFRFGPKDADWIGCVGDWDGDGDDNPGLFLQSNAKWRIRYENSWGPYDLLFKFGVDNAGMLPIPGDWDGA